LIASRRSKPVFRQGWSGDEELFLLAGLRIHGLGNWIAVSDYVGIKSAQECEHHYVHTYLQSRNAPFPVLGVRSPSPPPPLIPYDTRPVRSKPFQPSTSKPPTFGDNHGWMRYRHEFEQEFSKEAEIAVAPLRFGENQTLESFERTLGQLIDYNDIVAKRSVMNREIEKWGIQNMRPDDDDVCAHCLKGETDEEREIDKQIISLSCYVQKEQIEQFSHLLHQKAHLAFAAKRLQMNRRYEIKTPREEETCAVLATIAQSRVWEETDIAKWNEEVEKYRDPSFAGENDSTLELSQREVAFCTQNMIDCRFFLETKKLIIRDFEARGTFGKRDLARVSRGRDREIGLIYEFIVKSGWVS
jgi:hypothetical protein